MIKSRKASPSDIDKIYEIYCQRFDSHDDPCIKYTKKDWGWYLDSNFSVINVLEKENNIVAFVFAYDMGIWGYIEHIVVDEKSRKKGYAKILLEDLVILGRKKEWRVIESCYYSEISEMKEFFEKMSWNDGGINTRWVFKEIS